MQCATLPAAARHGAYAEAVIGRNRTTGPRAPHRRVGRTDPTTTGGSMIRVAFIIGDYPPEERRLREEVARSYSTPEVEVGILSVKPSPFGGLSPAEIQLVAPYFHAAYLQAEREGYDAAVPLGTLDLGVDGGRSLVDIPVVGPCEAMFHIAAQLGERFGIICYHESVIPGRSRRRATTAWSPGLPAGAPPASSSRISAPTRT